MPFVPFKRIIFFRGLIYSHKQVVPIYRVRTQGLAITFSLLLRGRHNLLVMLYSISSARKSGLCTGATLTSLSFGKTEPIISNPEVKERRIRVERLIKHTTTSRSI